MESCTIAVDVMGGDNAPEVNIEGIKAALAEDPDLHILAVGKPEALVELHIDRCETREASEVIEMDEHPANAVRSKKDSSIVVGCKAVKAQEADGFYSAGSTGAVLAGATLYAGRVKGVARPMLGIVLPAKTGPLLFCDIGANADCKPEYLAQFGIMGRYYMRAVFGIEEPTVGLLNIGEEDTKGSAFAQETNALMYQKVPGFVGNAQGKDLLNGGFDVIVTDGFTGNVCLKAIEGTVKYLFLSIKDVLYSSTKNKIGGALINKSLHELKDDVNPDKYGGALLIGAAGACCIGHGNSNAEAIKYGILVTAAAARSQTNTLIAEALQNEKAAQEGEPRA